MWKRRSRPGPPLGIPPVEPAEASVVRQEDVADLLQREDVAGLIRALREESPDTVLVAAEAIRSLHREGSEPIRQETSACGPALIDAYGRVRDKYAHSLTGMTRGYAGWSVVGALDEIRAPEAGPLLVSIVNDSSADKTVRYRAASALGRIPGPGRTELLAELLVHPPAYTDLGRAAAEGLIEMGDEGLAIVREWVMGPRGGTSDVWSVMNELKRAAAAGGGQAAAAAQILDELSTAEKGREAEKRAAEEQRLAGYPLATKLAGLLGNPGWVVDSRTIKPGPKADQYREALARCKKLGLPIDENEEMETGADPGHGASLNWADVEFEGETFRIDGGRQMYFGDEW